MNMTLGIKQEMHAESQKNDVTPERQKRGIKSLYLGKSGEVTRIYLMWPENPSGKQKILF